MPSLAPIHNPNSYSVIEFCERHLPGVPQYAVFDTSFHAGMPEVSRQYAIPQDLAQKYGFHKYGFHGLLINTYQRKQPNNGQTLESLKLILCHRVPVVKRSSHEKWYFSRYLNGLLSTCRLVMSTRCGDLDPEIPLEMVLTVPRQSKLAGFSIINPG